MNNIRALSVATLILVALGSLAIFSWPLLVDARDQGIFAQGVFIGLMPALLVLAWLETTRGAIDSRRLAILGVLIALNAVIRLMGAGVSGIETAFFVIVLGAYVFGPAFGFILGSSSLLLSALLGAGVGPWLPFQMMAAGLLGMGAGLLGGGIARRPWERTRLVTYSIAASFAYGALMTMWNWPFLAGTGSSVSYLPGANIVENLTRFVRFELVTGGLLWDLGRAVTTSVLVLAIGPALLSTLRRAGNRAGFLKSVSD